LTERFHEPVDLDAPIQQPPAPAWPRAVSPETLAATSSHRGAPFTHDWPSIIVGDADFSRTFRKEQNRAPTRQERRDAVEKKLGITHTPHDKTLWKHLPKIAPI
jgi:hypothetical protein